MNLYNLQIAVQTFLPFINHIDSAAFNQVCKYQSNQAFCTRTFATIRSGNARMYLS